MAIANAVRAKLAPYAVVQECALVCRISQESARQGDSLEYQEAALREWAKKLSNDQVRFNIRHVFKDDGVSAWSHGILERPAMMKLMDAVEAGEVKVVLIKGISRFNRDNAEAQMFVEWLDGVGVRLMSLEEGFDSAERGSAAHILHMHAFLSKMESDKKSVAVKIAMRQKAEKGEWKGGIPPYGFEYNPKTKKIQPIERLRPIVLDIFSQAAEGVGAGKIAREFNQTRKWAHLDDRTWTTELVKRMISRRAYVGDLIYGQVEYKYNRVVDRTVSGGRAFGGKKRNTIVRPEDEVLIVENAHEGIVSRELFDAVQEQVKLRAQPGRRTYQPNAKYPLTGLLVCGHCGGYMGHHGRNTDKGYCYYQCNNKARKGLAECQQENVRADKLETMIYSLLWDNLMALRDNEAFWQRFATKEGPGAGLARRIVEIKKKVAKHEEKLADLIVNADDLKSTIVDRAIKAINEQLKNLEAELARLEAEQATARRGKEAAENLREEIEEIVRRGPNFENETRESLRKLFHRWIEKITLFNDGHGGGYKGRGRKKQVEIVWKVDTIYQELSEESGD